MYINGIGRTKFGILDKSLPELLYEAMVKAIMDSKLSIYEIEAIVISSFLCGNSNNQLHLGSLISSLLPGLNLPCFRIEAACASGGMAVFEAINMLKNYDNILVVGGEKLSESISRSLIKSIAMAGDLLRDQREGVIFPAQYAIVASEYLRTYNLNHRDLSLVALKNYRHAKLNDLAHFNYKCITEQDIASSPIICSPLHMYDCCPISDGSAALVVSNEKISDRSVKIIGHSAICDSISLSQRNETISFKSARLAANSAFKMAKRTPKDIDIAEVHDCFTIAELVAMEDLGFCSKGNAIKLLKEGDTSLTGTIPINTDGGLLADGHPIGATGIAQICELVLQLRGEASQRQIDNAKIGLSHNVGGVGGTAVVHILEGC